MTAQESRYYTVSQAAARLGVSRITIWRWIRDGHLRAMRLGPRTTRIQREDIERALAQIEASGTRTWLSDSGADLGDVARPSSPFVGGLHTAAHAVQFYDDDATLVEVVADFIGGGLSSGDTAIVLATESHRAGVEARLREWGLDLESAIAGGRYSAPDAAEMLERIMVAGTPDAERFAETVSLIHEGLNQNRPVRQFGEMSPLLNARGNSAAAVRLEHLANGMPRQSPYSRLCAYHLGDFGSDAAGALSDVCSAHEVVISVARSGQLLTERDRSHAVVALQQKVHWLEAQLEERQQLVDELRHALAEQDTHQQTISSQATRDEDVPGAAHEAAPR